MNESTRLDKLSLLMGYISGQVKILDNIADMEDDGLEHPFVDNNYLKGSIYGAIDALATEAGSIVDWLRNRSFTVEDIDELLDDVFGSESEVEPEQMVAGWSKRHGWMNPAPYTHWMDGGLGITNFGIKDLPLYLQAIEKHGDSSLYIDKAMGLGANNNGMRGLYHNNRNGDLSDFWKIFDALRKERDVREKAAASCMEAINKSYSFTASSCHDHGTEPLSDTVTKEKMCGYTIIGPDNKVRFKDISKTFVRMIRDSPYAQDEQLWVAKDGLEVQGVVGICKIEDFK